MVAEPHDFRTTFLASFLTHWINEVKTKALLKTIEWIGSLKGWGSWDGQTVLKQGQAVPMVDWGVAIFSQV